MLLAEKFPDASRCINVEAVLLDVYAEEFSLDKMIEPVLITEDMEGVPIEYVWFISVVDNAFRYLLVVPWVQLSVVLVAKSVLNT